jgi:hypothetical protein
MQIDINVERTNLPAMTTHKQSRRRRRKTTTTTTTSTTKDKELERALYYMQRSGAQFGRHRRAVRAPALTDICVVTIPTQQLLSPSSSSQSSTPNERAAPAPLQRSVSLQLLNHVHSTLPAGDTSACDGEVAATRAHDAIRECEERMAKRGYRLCRFERSLTTGKLARGVCRHTRAQLSVHASHDDLNYARASHLPLSLLFLRSQTTTTSAATTTTAATTPDALAMNVPPPSTIRKDLSHNDVSGNDGGVDVDRASLPFAPIRGQLRLVRTGACGVRTSATKAKAAVCVVGVCPFDRSLFETQYVKARAPLFVSTKSGDTDGAATSALTLCYQIDVGSSLSAASNGGDHVNEGRFANSNSIEDEDEDDADADTTHCTLARAGPAAVTESVFIRSATKQSDQASEGTGDVNKWASSDSDDESTCDLDLGSAYADTTVASSTSASDCYNCVDDDAESPSCILNVSVDGPASCDREKSETLKHRVWHTPAY